MTRSEISMSNVNKKDAKLIASWSNARNDGYHYYVEKIANPVFKRAPYNVRRVKYNA